MFLLCDIGSFPSGSVVKNLPAMQDLQETRVLSLGWEDPLEEAWHDIAYLGMATHSSILAWKIQGTEEPGRLHTVHRVAKSRTQLKWLRMHACDIRQGLSLRGPEIALMYNEEVMLDERGKGLSEWEEGVQSQKHIKRLGEIWRLVNTSMRVLSFYKKYPYILMLTMGKTRREFCAILATFL